MSELNYFETKTLLKAYVERALENLGRCGNTLIGDSPVGPHDAVANDLKIACDLAEALRQMARR